MDFEMATGLRLPGAARHRVACDGSRWRRGATDGAVLAVGAVTTQGVTHQLEKIQGGKKARYRCALCLREGGWDARKAFLKFSCAGKPEIRAEAVRRHRLHASTLKMDSSSTITQAIPPLGERS